MKLALLKGNRFNPWHLEVYKHLRGDVELTAFRAESEIQRYFQERGESTLGINVEPIFFDTQVGNVFTRYWNRFGERYLDRAPRILPFHDRLRGYDVIQTWELFTDWSEEALNARTRFGIPVVVMTWDNIPFNMERSHERRALKAKVAREADAFIVHTERSRRVLDMEGVPEERITLMPPGVDIERFSPGPGRREALGLADDDFVILFVGWLLPRKGIDFLVLALRELLRDPALRQRRIRLLVVGSGPGRERVEELVTRAGVKEAVTFAGSTPYTRMPEFFRASDLYVLPSIAMPAWQEQFGMALIEAMACGVPTIATLTGGVPEIAGDAAVLVQPNDFFTLYDNIKRLITDATRRSELAAAARARAVDVFDMRKQAGALTDVYEAVVPK